MARAARALPAVAAGALFAALFGWVLSGTLAPGHPARPATTAAADAGEYVTVLEVIDGDTIVVERGSHHEHVRLIGIDAPETHDSPKLDRLVARGHDRARVVALGRASAAFARRLLASARVRLELDVEPRDRYGRLLAYAWVDDGSLVNATLLEAGQARLLTIPPNVRYVDRFVALEREARRARRGLWGAPPTRTPAAR